MSDDSTRPIPIQITQTFDGRAMLDVVASGAQILLGDSGRTLWVCTLEHGTVLRMKVDTDFVFTDRRYDTRETLRTVIREAFESGRTDVWMDGDHYAEAFLQRQGLSDD